MEIPYTLPQDFTLFVLLRQTGIDIWKRKLDWIASKGGMAVMTIHPDYINFSEGRGGFEQYPLKSYVEFLGYVKNRYDGEYYHVLPRDLCAHWKKNRVMQ